MSAGTASPQAWALLALAERAGQWEDLRGHARAIAASASGLSAAEMRALGRAYALYTSKLRSEWRGLAAIEETLQADSGAVRELAALRARLLPALREWYGAVEEDMARLQAAGGDQYALVFYAKARADNARYQLEDFRELRQSAGRREAAFELYRGAWEEAREGLGVVEPLRLAVALNYAVAQYELGLRPGEAAQFLQEALGAAVGRTEQILPANFRETAGLIQSMRDNVFLWSSSG